jgi:hypothetical protein
VAGACAGLQLVRCPVRSGGHGRPFNGIVRWQCVDDLQSPTQEHLRVSHAEERLQSFRADRMEAWGVVAALLLIPLIYSWDLFPAMAAVAAVLAVVLLTSTGASWAWRKLFKRHHESEP